MAFLLTFKSPDGAEDTMEQQETTGMVAEETQVEAPAEETTEETTETAEITEETTAEETEVVDQTPPKKTAQERINELTRLRREAEREREYWKQVALQKKEEGVTATTERREEQGPPRPVVSNFESVEQYEDALLDWHDTKKAAKAQMTEAQREEQTAIRTFQDNAKEIRKQYEDFDEVIEAPVFTPEMRQIILNSDNGPEVAYYLGRPENRELAERIKSLPGQKQIYELGKLESQIMIAKKAPKATRMPPPIRPVGATGTAQKDPSEMDINEWMAWNRRQEEEKIKKKYGG